MEASTGLGRLPSGVLKDSVPQTEASNGHLSWEASSELFEHLDGFSGIQILWITLVLSLSD